MPRRLALTICCLLVLCSAAVPAQLPLATATATATATASTLIEKAPTPLPDLSISFHIRGNSAMPAVVLRNHSGVTVTAPFDIVFTAPGWTYRMTVTNSSAYMTDLNGPLHAVQFDMATWTFFAPGTRYVATIDASNSVAESNEKNNSFAQTVGADECQPAADFVGSPPDLELSLSKDPDLALLYVTVTNRGGTFTQSGAQVITLKQSASPPYGNIFASYQLQTAVNGTALNALKGPARSTTIPFSLMYNPAVQFTVTVVVDAYCTIDENNESNNVASLTLNEGANPACLASPLAFCASAGSVCRPSGRSCASESAIRACAANGHTWSDVRCATGTHCDRGSCANDLP